MSNNLWKKERYTADIDFIIGSPIIELDIEKCNIHILYNANVIDKNTFDYLYNSDRMYRVIYIGNMLRANPSLNKVLSDGIMYAREQLFNILNLEDSDIISIRKDAVFFINSNNKLKSTEILISMNNIPIRFRICGDYTSFYKVKKLEMFYNSGRYSKVEQLSIAGISDEKLIYHNNYIIDFLKALFQTAEYNGNIAALDLLKRFYINYINLNLDIGYYREFNVNSLYTYKRISDYYIYQTNAAGNINDIDISYNENILRELIKIFSTPYFIRKY